MTALGAVRVACCTRPHPSLHGCTLAAALHRTRVRSLRTASSSHPCCPVRHSRCLVPRLAAAAARRSPAAAALALVLYPPSLPAAVPCLRPLAPRRVAATAAPSRVHQREAAPAPASASPVN
ncbi:hypothetical protein ZWY2020_040413 [Hordeum vulgare]|nr:hypothetical protein ZWY2020_040413 [Hordeum vulgare]